MEEAPRREPCKRADGLTKAHYTTRKKARAAARRVAYRPGHTGGKVKDYLCQCGFYHVGHPG